MLREGGEGGEAQRPQRQPPARQRVHVQLAGCGGGGVGARVAQQGAHVPAGAGSEGEGQEGYLGWSGVRIG